MSWAMHQVWISTGGTLERGPRFRSIADAIKHVKDHATEASFAIETPDGRWFRDAATGRSIFGRGGSEPGLAPTALGSRSIDTSAHRATVPEPPPASEDDEEITGEWSPDDPTKSRKVFG